MLMVSHNMLCRKDYPHFYENADIIRMNSPYYSKDEIKYILEQERQRKFIDINMKVRMKDKKAEHNFQDLLNLIGKYDVEWIGISSVEKPQVYGYIRALLGNDKTKICAKIETEKGCENVEEIMKAFDGIMVDNEDLAFQIGWIKAIEEKNRIYKLCEERNIPHFRLVGTIFEYKGE